MCFFRKYNSCLPKSYANDTVFLHALSKLLSTDDVKKTKGYQHCEN